MHPCIEKNLTTHMFHMTQSFFCQVSTEICHGIVLIQNILYDLSSREHFQKFQNWFVVVKISLQNKKMRSPYTRIWRMSFIYTDAPMASRPCFRSRLRLFLTCGLIVAK